MTQVPASNRCKRRFKASPPELCAPLGAGQIAHYRTRLEKLSFSDMPCPHCQKDAPVVYKGIAAFCSACDRPRAPFSGKSLTFAGQPAQVAGKLGRAVGVLVLIFGLLFAAVVMLFFQLLAPAAHIGYAVGLPVALVSVVVGTLLMFVSRRLRRSGSEVERQTRVEALYALAVHRGGLLTATDAAHSLRFDAREAESLLHELARTEPDHVSLEFDDEGHTFYVFSRPGAQAQPFGVKYRVSREGKVRVSDAFGGDRPAEGLAPAARGRADR